jgi:hypothetical protein
VFSSHPNSEDKEGGEGGRESSLLSEDEEGWGQQGLPHAHISDDALIAGEEEGFVHHEGLPIGSIPPCRGWRAREREMCPWAISKYFGGLVSNTSA